MIGKNELEFSYVTDFTRMYEDRDSGATKDGAFWRPKVPPGFYFFGDHAVNNYDDIGQNKDVVIVARPMEDNKDKPLFLPPIDFEFIWDDRGSGAKKSASMWRPVPPGGYVALGVICQPDYDKPSLDKSEGLASLRCIREDLVLPASIGEMIWSDAQSGAHKDFSAWKIQAPAAAAGMTCIALGSFVGVQSHSKPSGDLSTYVLQYPIELKTVGTLEKPKYDRHGNLSKSEYVVTTQQILPWFAVTDPNLTRIQQLHQSPIYTIQRSDIYYLKGEYENISSITQTHKVTFTSGTSKTASQFFSSTTGIEFAASYGSEGGLGFSVKLSESFTLSTSTENSWNESTEIEYDTDVPAHTKVSVFIKKVNTSCFVKAVSRSQRPSLTPLAKAFCGCRFL